MAELRYRSAPSASALVADAEGEPGSTFVGHDRQEHDHRARERALGAECQSEDDRVDREHDEEDHRLSRNEWGAGEAVS